VYGVGISGVCEGVAGGAVKVSVPRCVGAAHTSPVQRAIQRLSGHSTGAGH